MTFAQKTILFFTAGPKPTTQEATDIGIMQDLGNVVKVRDASKYGTDTDQGSPEVANFYMDSNSGATIPTAYANTGTYPRTTKTAPPAPVVLSTQKVITSGSKFLSSDKSGSYTNGFTPTITAGVVSTMLAS